MPKQKGIIKLEGTIGDLTFVKTKDGYLAKQKTSVNFSNDWCPTIHQFWLVGTQANRPIKLNAKFL